MRRNHVEPLPKDGNIIRMLQFVRRALDQQQVLKVEITPKGVEVVREMSNGDEPVVPNGTDDVDISFVLERTEVSAVPFSPERHPLYTLFEATKIVNQKDREVFAIVAPGWPMLAAWLGVEETKQPPQAIFGTRVLYVPAGTTNDRIVVLGARPGSMFLSDVDTAVAVDLGV